MTIMMQQLLQIYKSQNISKFSGMLSKLIIFSVISLQTGGLFGEVGVRSECVLVSVVRRRYGESCVERMSSPLLLRGTFSMTSFMYSFLFFSRSKMLFSSNSSSSRVSVGGGGCWLLWMFASTWSALLRCGYRLRSLRVD